MLKRTFLILVLFSIGGLKINAQNPNRSGKDYAYFFYIDDYQTRTWSDLPETKRESEKIAGELSSAYGFYTELIRNPSKTDIENKFLEISQKNFGAKDQVLFFFSGHGYFFEDEERGYFIPSDAKSIAKDPLVKTWLSFDDLGSYINRSNCEHVLVAIDACYSGAFGDRWKGNPVNTPWNEKKDCNEIQQAALKYPSRFYFTSGSKTQRTPADSKFANRFLTALRERATNGIAGINDLRYYFGTIDFPKPEGGTFTKKHEEGGGFIFVSKNGCSGSKGLSDAKDKEHWMLVSALQDRKIILQHLERFPGCEHHLQIVKMLAATALEKNNTSNPKSSYKYSNLESPEEYHLLYKEEKENESKALIILLEGRERFPEDLPLLFEEINYYISQGNYSEILKSIDFAIKKEPENSALYLVRGSCYDHFYQQEMERGEDSKSKLYFVKALNNFIKAIEINPAYFDAYYNAGALYYNKAAKILEIMNKLGFSKEETRKYEEYKKETEELFEGGLPFFKRCEAINPNDINTLMALKTIFKKLEKNAAAKIFSDRYDSVKKGQILEKSYYSLETDK